MLTCENLFCINCHTFFRFTSNGNWLRFGKIFFLQFASEWERERNELESIKLNFGIKKRRKKRNSSFELFFLMWNMQTNIWVDRRNYHTCAHYSHAAWQSKRILAHMLSSSIVLWRTSFEVHTKEEEVEKMHHFRIHLKITEYEKRISIKNTNESTMISCKWDGVHTH